MKKQVTSGVNIDWNGPRLPERVHEPQSDLIETPVWFAEINERLKADADWKAKYKAKQDSSWQVTMADAERFAPRPPKERTL